MDSQNVHIANQFKLLHQFLSNPHIFDQKAFLESYSVLSRVIDVNMYILNYYKENPQNKSPNILKLTKTYDSRLKYEKIEPYLESLSCSSRVAPPIKQNSKRKTVEELGVLLDGYSPVTQNEFYLCVKSSLLHLSNRPRDIMRVLLRLLRKCRNYNQLIYKMNRYLMSKQSDILEHFIHYIHDICESVLRNRDLKLKKKKEKNEEKKKKMKDEDDNEEEKEEEDEVEGEDEDDFEKKSVEKMMDEDDSDEMLIFDLSEPTRESLERVIDENSPNSSPYKTTTKQNSNLSFSIEDFRTEEEIDIEEENEGFIPVYVPMDFFRLCLHLFRSPMDFANSFTADLRQRLRSQLFCSKKMRTNILRLEHRVIDVLKKYYTQPDLFQESLILLHDFEAGLHNLTEGKYSTSSQHEEEEVKDRHLPKQKMKDEDEEEEEEDEDLIPLIGQKQKHHRKLQQLSEHEEKRKEDEEEEEKPLGRSENHLFICSNQYWGFDYPAKNWRPHQKVVDYVVLQTRGFMDTMRPRRVYFFNLLSELHISITLNGHDLDLKLNLIESSILYTFFDHEGEAICPAKVFKGWPNWNSGLGKLLRLCVIVEDQNISSGSNGSPMRGGTSGDNVSKYRVNVNYSPQELDEVIEIERQRRISMEIEQNDDPNKQKGTKGDTGEEGWGEAEEKLGKMIVYMLTNFEELTYPEIHQKLVLVMGYPGDEKSVELFCNELVKRNLILFQKGKYIVKDT